MVTEVLEAMGPREGGVYCDATVGLAGHALALLEACGPDGRLLGVDRDEDALTLAAERLSPIDGGRWSLHHAPFSSLRETLAGAGVDACDGVLADLGVSSMQIDEPGRGFSFRERGPLDMRMDRSEPGTVLDVLRGWSVRDIERVLREYGEERLAARVARRLRRAAREGRVRDTLDLAREIRGAVGRGRSGGIDAATRSFQALRIAVNHEVDELEELLEQVVGLLSPGGVFVCLSYHSIEDRMVKRALRACAARGDGEVLTRKPITPGREEIRQNRRARSAKLRAFRRSAGTSGREGS
jgi:16S rRNA (cytosine1402-N4)-methyltransferase